MNERQASVESIRSGRAILGIELGSTRIKASLIGPDTTPLALGSHAWENQLKDGVWTYDMEDVWKGLAACYASLVDDVRARYSLELKTVAAMGFSAMMHGYVALDVEGRLLVPFRTWRNNITERACAELSPLLDFAVPQRWSIAHLYQSILDEQPHVRQIAHLTTLAGYVHWRLTGEHKVGVGEASGMFPVDPRTADWDAQRMGQFDALIEPLDLGWKLREILTVLPAGRPAGTLTVEGAKLLDPSGELPRHHPLSSRGRRGHWHGRHQCRAATLGKRLRGHIGLCDDRAREKLGARPRGDRHRRYARRDAGSHGALQQRVVRSRCLDRPLRPGGQRVGCRGAGGPLRKLLPLAMQGDPDAGGLLSINYVSGEHMTGYGGPTAVRAQPGQQLHPGELRSAMYFASLCALRTGMNILTEQEGVIIEEIRGHGGFFKGGDTGQRMMAAALDVPVSIPATAGEGGAWGMAVLAAFMLRADDEQSLPDYLDEWIARSIGKPIKPDPRDVKGFAEFFARHEKGLAIERESVKALS